MSPKTDIDRIAFYPRYFGDVPWQGDTSTPC